jgi:triacylglycerol lipase
MIVPAKSSQLGIGKEVNLPVLLHPLMLTDNRSLEIVAETLTSPVNL